MSEMHERYRRVTGYSYAGSIVLAFLGFWLILFTFPNFFYYLTTVGFPPGMAMIIDTAHSITADILDGSRAVFADILRLPLAVILPVLIWLLIAATTIRAIRVKSWQPLVTVSINLGLGIVAFPLFAWILRFITWIISVARQITSWAGSLSGRAETGILRIGSVVGVLIVIVFAVAGLAYLLRSSRKARWLVPGLAAVGVIGYFLRNSLAVFLDPLSGGLDSAQAAVTLVVSFVVRLLTAIAIWVVALFLLAYLA